MDEPVPEHPGRRVPLALKLGLSLVAAMVGAVAGAVIGAYLYNAVYPPHGCGDIGCWDFLVGGFIGGLIGLVSAPVAVLFWLKRRPPGGAGPR